MSVYTSGMLTPVNLRGSYYPMVRIDEGTPKVFMYRYILSQSRLLCLVYAFQGLRICIT